MPRSLLNNARLELALDNFDERNLLMKELDLSPVEDKKKFYKLVLAFWLGSTVTLFKLTDEKLLENCVPFIYKGYFCLLTLDKYISLLNPSSCAYKTLNDCRLDIFKFFNINYQLIIDDPQKLFQFFENKIKSIENLLTTQDGLILDKAKQECFVDLLKDSFFYPTSTQVNDHTSLRTLNPTNMNIQINKFLTCSHDKYPFYIYLNNDKDYLINKLLLPTDDGIIIDGLHVKKKNTSSKYVVLALVGHFASENTYIANNVTEFFDLFGTDIVFINHRNYSQRSAKLADSIDRLAQDVIYFAKYFTKKNKNVVLYGMCGGAAHMILAADSLMKENIKFKLIIDRFAKEYSNFIDTKTLVRASQFGKKTPSPLVNALINYPYAINLLSPAYLLFKLLLMATNTNRNFGSIVRTIPEKDLLILQAKSKKRDGELEPIYTDVIVHPKNDIREAIKDRRHQNKFILKSLRDQCKDISIRYSDSMPMKNTFKELAECFSACIDLINDEKLTLDDTAPDDHDLHSYHLFKLTTRNKVPLHQFINGFFRKSNKNLKNCLDELRPYPISKIIEALKITFDNGNKKSIVELAHKLNIFLNTLSANRDFIINMMNRLSNTGLKAASNPIQDLTTSEFFKILSHAPIHISQRARSFAK